MTTPQMTLAQYKALLDARYRGESVALTAAEQKRIERRAQTQRRDEDRDTPRWLLVRPDGQIDGTHVFSHTWSDEASVWRGFFSRKRERDALIRHGWTVRRDDADHSGFAAFLAQPRPTTTDNQQSAIEEIRLGGVTSPTNGTSAVAPAPRIERDTESTRE